jgi:pimeloyl-ACP methyl ester carboxylesterase
MILNASLLGIALGLGAGLVQAQQASNFDVPPELAEQCSCGEMCQAAIAQGNMMDLEFFGKQFDFDFYETADNFTGSKPGDLLKLQPIDPSTITTIPGVSAYKIQYTSRDLDGSPVPVTGFVTLPFAKTSRSFNVVAMAHGTSGGFRGCAPSTSPMLYDRQSWSTLVLAGYAVVVTDYAGLGNNHTAHKYLSNAAAANDVLYSVKAAQNAFGKLLSREWVALGHSQGGSAVWKLSEMKGVQDKRKSGYLGGVAMSPAAPRIHDQIQSALVKLQNSTDPRDFMIAAGMGGLVMGIQAVFPEYDPAWLGDVVKQRNELAEIAQLCVTAMGGMVFDLSLDQFLNSGDLSGDTYMAEFQAINGVGLGDRASSPLLVIHGEEDTVIPPEGTKAAFKGACKHKNPVHYTLYPGLAHSAVVTAASPEYLQFIADRFANVPFGRKCTDSVVVPVNLEYTEAPLE